MTAEMEYKGKPINECSNEQLCECIHALVDELNDANVRLNAIRLMLTSGSGYHRVQPKVLPPLSVEGRKGMEP